MNTETTYLDGAKWIGSPKTTSNTDWVDAYAVTADFEIISSQSAHFAVAARNKDFYVHIEINEKFAAVSEVYDGVKSLCGKYYMSGVLAKKNRIRIEVNRTLITLILNGETVINGEDIMPRDRPNKPRKAHMMCFGLPQREGEVRYGCIKLENTYNGEVYRESSFADDADVLAQLGTVKDGRLVVKKEFNLINPVPPVTVKKEFTPRGAVKNAYLYATARGFYDAYINGERVNDTFYNPGFTDYRKRIYYQTYDVTGMLKDGVNTVGATVAKGYYSGFVGYSGAMVYGRQNTFLGALAVEYTDGTREVIKTDETWLFTDRGAVVDADYQQGEMYDARYELDMGDSKVWTRCGAYEYLKYAVPTNGTLDNEPFELNAEPSGGAVAERTLKPTGEAYENPEGHFVLDLGQNMVGTVRVVMNGRRGRCIKLRYGEMCYSDGRIYNENYRNAANIDMYTMKGGREVFVPSFTLHGFRYIEVSGCGEQLTREDFDDMIVSVEGVVITNTTEVTGSFECSNPDINKLYENILWGQRGNSVMTFTDCPQRNERMGWTGDVQVFAKTAAYNMNIKSFMEKWLTDLRDSQLMYNRGGAVPDTAPLGGDNRPNGGCDGWGDAAVIVPWEMYKAYGDSKFLSDNYGMMKKWVDYQQLSENQTDFIQRRQRRGDHLAPDVTTPIILSATAYAANSARLLSRAAEVLGYAEDAEKYGALFENIKAAFQREWVGDEGQILYVPESGDTKNDRDLELNGDTKTNGDTKVDGGDTKVNASQTAYALAIDFDLLDGVKEGTREGLTKALSDWDNRLSVGFLGISHLLSALVKAGMTDKAFALLESTEYPGWLYSVRNGATTVWERWNSYIAETDTFGDFNMNSFNHYAYGSVGEWLYSDILGINTSEEKGETGYKRIILRPTCGGSLTYARGSLKTQYGVIKSEWSVEGGRFKYRCTVPENTTAELYFGGKKISLEAGEHEFEI